ncbi:MAG: hypothetical protein IRY83_02165 [Chloroflexi bacterium]|nr:hypothetical protein [Chloroflexota bacterium]HLG51121.1 hypothetical protein [Chloroflexota bacterium]
MLFFVKSECDRSTVDELTRKVINGEIQKVRGNIVYLSPDGCIGYDIVEARDESELRAKYAPYSGYLRLVEVSPILPAHEFYTRWEQQHPRTATAGR